MSEEILRVAFHIRMGVCFLVGIELGKMLVDIL